MAVQYQAIGARIRKMRKEKGITQQQMAENIGLSDIHYGRLERGERSLNLEQLEYIAQVLGVRVRDLLEGAFPDETMRRTDEEDENIHLLGVAELMRGMTMQKRRLVFDLCYVIASEH